MRRQAEELRIRAEEIERQRLADEAVLRAERESIEADRAEMRRQQEELQKHQAELRAKAEAEAAEKRRLEREAEQARKEAAAAPELEKLNSVLQAMAVAAEGKSTELGDLWWLPLLSTEFLAFCEQMRKFLKDRS